MNKYLTFCKEVVISKKKLKNLPACIYKKSRYLELLKIKKMNDSQKAVELLGGSLASLLELSKKLLIEWKFDARRIIHVLSHLRKSEWVGLMKGTHEIRCKKKVSENSSIKFTPTDSMVSTIPSGRTYHLGTDRKQLIGIRYEGGLFDYVDSNIEYWFGNVLSSDEEVVSGRVHLFNENITQQDIITEGERLKIYQEYDIVEGLLLANELVKIGTIEEIKGSVIIYLKNRRNDIRCFLKVFRYGPRNLNIQIGDVNPHERWNAGDGALFSN